MQQLWDASRALSRAPELGVQDFRHHILALAGCSATKPVTIQEDSRTGEVHRRLAVDSTLNHMEASQGELTKPAPPWPDLTVDLSCLLQVALLPLPILLHLPSSALLPLHLLL